MLAAMLAGMVNVWGLVELERLPLGGADLLLLLTESDRGRKREYNHDNRAVIRSGRASRTGRKLSVTEVTSWMLAPDRQKAEQQKRTASPLRRCKGELFSTNLTDGPIYL